MSSVGGGVARHFNRARKIPPHIGKDPSGRAIPFGPFTVYQPIVAVVVGVLAHNTSGWWGSDHSAFFAGGMTLLLALGAGWGTGFIDVTGRNPAILVYGAIRALLLPVDGTGVPKRARRPHATRTFKAPLVMWAEPNQPEPALEPTPATEPADEAVPAALADEEAPDQLPQVAVPPVNAARQSGLEAFLTTLTH